MVTRRLRGKTLEAERAASSLLSQVAPWASQSCEVRECSIAQAFATRARVDVDTRWEPLIMSVLRLGETAMGWDAATGFWFGSPRVRGTADLERVVLDAGRDLPSEPARRAVCLAQIDTSARRALARTRVGMDAP